MSGFPARYDRSIRLFGAEGQRKLRQTKVVVVGVGGLGSSLAQHIALLGLGEAALVDDQELDETNRNRFVGARSSDSVPGSPKVELAVRLIREINPEVVTVPIKRSLVTSEAFDVIKNADWVFGCLDEDGPRFILNELCAAYAIPYVDLASDVPEPGIYGGRVCIASDGKGCVSCLRVLDQRSVRRYLATEEEREKEDAIYGISRLALGEAGPSVSPINGVIAALAATEFMVAATGMRAPTRLLEYRAHISKVLVINDAPSPNCYYCRGIRGKQAEADAERYLKVPHLRDGTMTARA